MKKRFISLLLLFCMLLPLTACAANGGGGELPTEPEQPESTSADGEESTTDPSEESTTDPDAGESTDPEQEVLEKKGVYDFLFVGNSYTYYNDMPEQIFEAIMDAAGYNARVMSVTKGGWYLIDSADPTDELGRVVETSFAEKNFEFVILQEQSTCPALAPGQFYTGVRRLAARAIADGATPVLYSTWGRKEGNSVLTQNGWTNESMTWKIAAAYAAIGEELGLAVAPAGLAFFDVHRNADYINLYDADLTHPSYAGSYLAAMTLFARITGVDPTTVDFSGSLNPTVAETLKRAARKAVFETPEIPAEYQTSSEGVEYVPPYRVDASAMRNLTSFPVGRLISVLQGGSYPNGKSFSGILGTKNAIASAHYALTGLSAEQKADIADIGYGVSVIGIEKMFSGSKGYTTAVENLVNGHWGSSLMASFAFDDLKYDINGNADPDSPYTGLITLNFGSRHRFDAIGFASGSLEGFPGAAEVFVSDDGVNWRRVSTACWDQVNGKELVSCGKMTADPWNGNTATVTCLFDMGGVEGQYIRIGVVVGRNDSADQYNTINTREILVYGDGIQQGDQNP